MLSAAGRALATRPLPVMPAGVENTVADAIRRANGELQDLASELLHEAGALMERATWAELGGTSSVAWLMPGLSYLPSSMPGPSHLTGVSTWGAGAEGALWPSERWAVGLLEEMSEVYRQGPADSEGFDDARRAQLLASALDDGDEAGEAGLVSALGDGDETGEAGLGVLAMTAGAGLDTYDYERTVGVGVTQAGLAASQGALTVPVPEGASGVALTGLLGCLRAGGVLGSSEAPHTDD